MFEEPIKVRTRIYIYLGFTIFFMGGALLIGGTGVLIAGIFCSFFFGTCFNLLAGM